MLMLRKNAVLKKNISLNVPAFMQGSSLLTGVKLGNIFEMSSFPQNQ